MTSGAADAFDPDFGFGMRMVEERLNAQQVFAVGEIIAEEVPGKQVARAGLGRGQGGGIGAPDVFVGRVGLGNRPGIDPDTKRGGQ